MGAPIPRDAEAGVRLAPREVCTLRFRLAVPGTYYYYWGSTTGREVNWRTGEDAQLTGAIVVDPADGPPRHDRILDDVAGDAGITGRRSPNVAVRPSS